MTAGLGLPLIDSTQGGLSLTMSRFMSDNSCREVMDEVVVVK